MTEKESQTITALAVPVTSELLPDGWAEESFWPVISVADLPIEELLGLDEELAAAARAHEGMDDVDEWRRAVAFVRRRIGESIEPMQPGPKSSSDASDKLTQADRERRSSYRAVAEAPEDKFLAWCRKTPAWSKLVKRSRSWRNQTAEQEAREIVLADVAVDGQGERWRLLAGDFRDRLTELPDGSADMIVTDPPYPAEFLPLWSDLAEHAARVLAPQGILVALSGQMHLPDVMTRLGEHLSWGWVYIEPLPAAANRMVGRHILSNKKPWLAYSNGTWPSGRIDWHSDLIDPEPRSKSRYRWEQATGAASYLIEALCPEGGTVLDPMAGTGSYGQAALDVGRRFIGVEADAERFTMCIDRIGP